MPKLMTDENGQQVEVYTAEELAERERAAAATAAEQARREAEADPNGLGARIRREEAAKVKAKDKEIKDLTEKLAQAGQTSEQVTAIQQQLADAVKAKADAEAAVAAKDAEQATNLAVLTGGVKPELLKEALVVLKARGADFSTPEATKAALDSLKQTLPSFFGAGAPYNPNGGPTNPPPRDGGAVSYEEASKLPMGEYRKLRAEGKIV